MNASGPAHLCPPPNESSGFTLIEIVVVLVAIGIMSAVALVRLPDTLTMTTRSEVDTLRVHLQYAQLRALTRHALWGIAFSDDQTYWLYYVDDDGYTIPAILPGEAAMNAVNDPDGDPATINNRYLTVDLSRLDTTGLPAEVASGVPSAAVAKIEFNTNGSQGRTDREVWSSGSNAQRLFTIIAYTGVFTD